MTGLLRDARSVNHYLNFIFESFYSFRLSFPSLHASLSMYSAMFLAVRVFLCLKLLILVLLGLYSLWNTN